MTRTGAQQEANDPSAEPPADPHAWVERYGDYLYRFALSRVRRADVAEDLVQDTLLAAWRGLERFAGQASVQTWLTAILKRRVIDWLRQQLRERATLESEPDPIATGLFTRRGEWRMPPGRVDRGDPAAALDREEFWEVLRGCLGKLPTRLHNAFVLRYLDEVAGAEVCRELGISPTNLWVILHRARLRMWWCLSRNWYGEGPQGEVKP